jgi:superfamily II DNA or RNA helicase
VYPSMGIELGHSGPYEWRVAFAHVGGARWSFNPCAVMELRFDRGTLVLTHPARELDLAGAPGVRWDIRVHAHRAPASSYSGLKRWLLDRGARFQDLAPPPGPAKEAWSDIDLRPYQEAALSAWELGHRRGVVALPTGSGKTRLALAAMHRTGLSTLCLVPTRVLLDQWLREIGGVYRGAVGCYGDGVRQLAPLTVATFESAYRHMDQLGDRFRLLVADEVHHFGGGLRDEALEMAVADARLGLTATPPRTPGAAARLAELVGPTVFELTVADLAGGFLASFDAITLYLDLAPAERSAYASLAAVFTRAYTEFHRMAPGARWVDFALHSARTAEGRRALSTWRQMRRLLSFTHAKRRALASLLGRHRYSRVLIFTADNETAYAIAREHLVMPLTCDIGSQERDDALERFRRGDIRTLVSARVLNEGLDVPDADVAVIVGGALGEREHVQRVGRLLRPSEGKRALVYELVTRNTIEVGLARRRRQGLATRRSAQL